MDDVGTIVAIAVGAAALAAALSRVIKAQLRVVIREEVQPKLDELHQCVDRRFGEVRSDIAATNVAVARIEGPRRGR